MLTQLATVKSRLTLTPRQPRTPLPRTYLADDEAVDPWNMTKLSSSVHLLFILFWFYVFPGVRKFIRNTKTKAFLAKDGGWTNDVESAVEFYNDEQVRESRNAYRLKYCQLYYCIGSNPSKLDFAFSLARWAKCIGTSSSTKPSKIR